MTEQMEQLRKKVREREYVINFFLDHLLATYTNIRVH